MVIVFFVFFFENRCICKEKNKQKKTLRRTKDIFTPLNISRVIDRTVETSLASCFIPPSKIIRARRPMLTFTSIVVKYVELGAAQIAITVLWLCVREMKLYVSYSTNKNP